MYFSGSIAVSNKSVAKLSFTAEIYSLDERISVATETHNFQVDVMDSDKKHLKVTLPHEIEFTQDFKFDVITHLPNQLTSVCELGNGVKGTFMNKHSIMTSFTPFVPQPDCVNGQNYEFIFIVDCSGMLY